MDEPLALLAKNGFIMFHRIQKFLGPIGVARVEQIEQLLLRTYKNHILGEVYCWALSQLNCFQEWFQSFLKRQLARLKYVTTNHGTVLKSLERFVL